MTTSAEHRAPCGGGLYVATLGTFKAAIIVPPIVKGLADLQCEPRIDAAQRTPETITTLITFAQLWGMARLPGDLIAGARRAAVLRALTAHIHALLGGRAWAIAEAECSHANRRVDLSYLKHNISQDRRERGIGMDLHLRQRELAEMQPAQRVRVFASLVEEYGLVSPNQQQAWLAELALRMASNLVTVAAWAGEDIDAGIKGLLGAPTLARAARFFVLAVAEQKESLAAANEVYAGWGWPQ